ncbi:MAG: hypothetical protein K8U03_24755 [Planctomycetia bacterium]|nr:hypothetical protein [Planctomycetia bacterium]
MRRILLALILMGVVGAVAAPSEASAAYSRSVSRGGGGVVGRAFATRLYYSNAFRGLIPGTGYGGFRRPAFGYRGY